MPLYIYEIIKYLCVTATRHSLAIYWNNPVANVETSPVIEKYNFSNQFYPRFAIILPHSWSELFYGLDKDSVHGFSNRWPSVTALLLIEKKSLLFQTKITDINHLRWIHDEMPQCKSESIILSFYLYLSWVAPREGHGWCVVGGLHFVLMSSAPGPRMRWGNRGRSMTQALPPQPGRFLDLISRH